MAGYLSVKYRAVVEHFSRRKKKFKELPCHDGDEDNKENVKRRVSGVLKRPWKGNETDWSSILDSPSYSLSEFLFSCVQLSSFG